MGYSNTTPNYKLPQYLADDRPSYLGDWNEAMSAIDTGMNTNKKAISDTDVKVSNMKQYVDNAVEDVTNSLNVLESNVNSKLENVYTKGESDSKYLTKLKGGHLVVIGDSISYGTGTTNPSTDAWPVLFSASRSMTLHNYAQNNAGFMAAGTGTPSRNFAQQIEAAKTDVSFDNNDVKLVIVAGGINDNQYVTSVQPAVTSTLTSAKVAFPRAKIVFIPLLAGKAPLPGLTGGDRSLLIKPLVNGGLASGVMVVQGAWTWMIGQTAYASDDIHPNTAGAKYYAQVIDGCIEGGSTYAVHKDFANSFGTNVKPTTTGVSAIAENGFVTVGGQFQISASLTGQQKLFSLPSFCASTKTISLPCIYDGNLVFLYKFQGTNDVSVLKSLTKTAEVDVYIPPITWPIGQL